MGSAHDTRPVQVDLVVHVLSQGEELVEAVRVAGGPRLELPFGSRVAVEYSAGETPPVVHVELLADRVRFVPRDDPSLAGEPLHAQVDRLAQFIVDHFPGEPSQSQGAVDTALRLLAAAAVAGVAGATPGPDPARTRQLLLAASSVLRGGRVPPDLHEELVDLPSAGGVADLGRVIDEHLAGAGNRPLELLPHDHAAQLAHLVAEWGALGTVRAVFASLPDDAARLQLLDALAAEPLRSVAPTWSDPTTPAQGVTACTWTGRNQDQPPCGFEPATMNARMTPYTFHHLVCPLHGQAAEHLGYHVWPIDDDATAEDPETDSPEPALVHGRCTVVTCDGEGTCFQTSCGCACHEPVRVEVPLDEPI